MEPYSKILGGAEECQSSESGWTMYIGSPNTGDDDGDSSDNEGTTEYAEEDDESDDSMASDASSGPSHHGVNIDPWGGNGKRGSYGFEHFKQDEEEEEEKYDGKRDCLDKKVKAKNKAQEKQIEGKRVEKKEMVYNIINGSKGKAPVQGVSKVRKRK